MNNKNDWITQGTKMSRKHKTSLYAFTKNSNDPKAKVHYIKYCKILRRVIKEAMKFGNVSAWHLRLTQLFLLAIIGGYNYMFRPYPWAIFRLYHEIIMVSIF